MLITKMGTSCKLHMDNQWMRTYVLNVYIIHVKCVDIMVNHHLQLDIECDFTYICNYYISVIDFHYYLFMI
jgi:hypothetical protein